MMDNNKSKEKQQKQQKQSMMITTNNGSNNVGTSDGGGTQPNKTKEKRRSNEKRKEKSRDAARCRRSRETEIFTELAHVLPLRREDVEQLDKASVMRLSIAFLKVREMLKLFPNVKDIKTEEPTEDKQDDEKKLFDILNGPQSNKLLTQAIDGFLIILSGEGDVTYVSENISEYLGISQIDILGQQIWEYSHQCDHDEIKEALNVRRTSSDSIEMIKNKDSNQTKSDEIIDNNNSNAKPSTKNDNLKTAHRDFFIRLKCTLTNRGRSVNIKSASYKVIHMTGHIVMNADGERILVGIGRPLPHPSNIEIPLGSTTFLTKHSLDMKFTYADDNMLSLLGYQSEDLLGKSLYDYHYAADSENLMATFKSVISKGQCETNRYRFLGKYGGYSWVVTQATIVYDKQKPQSVVCVNYAISNLENDNEIYSCEQFEAFDKKKTEISDRQQQQQKISLENSKQQQQDQQKQKKSATTAIPAIIAAQNNKLSTIIEQRKSQQSVVENLDEKLLSPSKNSPNLVKSCYLQQKQDIPAQNTNSSFNKPNLIKLEENRFCRENSLSPIRQTFDNKCSINPVTAKTTGINNNNSVLQQQQQQQQQKKQSSIKPPIIQRGGPKTVTASVFKKVSVPQTKLGFSSSPTAAASINNNTTQPKPQSVTTSVLIPISSLTKNQQIFSRPLFISGGGGTSTIGSGGTNSSPNSDSITERKQQNQQQRTEDMNKGFPMFLDDPTELTMLKEEPDDLTHLAPTAGDACIPLDDSTPLFGEMLEGLMLPDSYGTLLSDDINSLDSQQSNNNCNNNNNKTHIDPFINYRDESSDTTGSPHLLSPGASKSPEVSSIPSLCSPHSLSQEDEFAFMTMNDEIDLTMRAPYIPMNEQEDLPLLTDDLMWSAFTEELHKDIKEALQIEIKNNCNNNNNNNNNNRNNCNNSSCDSINNCNNSNNHILNINNSGSNSSLNSCNSSLSSSISNNSSISSNNNNIDVNSESSLAALLCSNTNAISHNNHHIQVQGCGGGGGTITSTATILGQANNNNNNNQELSKKRKFELTENTSTASDDLVVDSIDAFGQVFNNKNSANLDCWTLNDLLQINPSTSSSLSQSDLKQNIIVNTAIPSTTATATFHVPLIALQHNGNKINLTRSSSIGSINQINTTQAKGLLGNSGGVGSIGVCIEDQSHQQCNKKLNMTKILTSSINPTTVNCSSGGGGIFKQHQSPNINIVINNKNNNNAIEIHNNNAGTCNNKRHLNVSTSLDTKRVKNSSSVEIQTSPQLLQQLMAPTPQRQKAKLMVKSQNSKWGASDEGGDCTQQNQQHQQQNANNNNSNNMTSSPSNSVLKNLLVSGCDDKIYSPEPSDVLMIDENSRDSIPDRYFNNQQLLSPGLNNYSKPLQCKIPTNSISPQLSRYCGSNPMIGGPGILPSPPIPIPSSQTGSDNNRMAFINNKNNNKNRNITSPLSYMAFSPKLMTFNDSDSGSDSGIECGTNGGNFNKASANYSAELSTKMNMTGPNNNKMINLSSSNPVPRIDLPPHLDPYADDSMSMSGDEAPPPLESTEFGGIGGGVLISSSAVSSPATTSLYSPLMMDPNSCNSLNNSSFLMDFCSDDYAMTDLLQDNEITKVLDEWNSEMT